MFIPYLKYGCSLEINHARTAAYVGAICEICTEVKRTMTVDSHCDILHWDVDQDDGVTVIPLDFTTPAANDCPWVDSANPESARFLGFMIDRATKKAHVRRSVSTRLSGSGGGVFETLRPEAQIIEFEVFLFACDSVAMEYGMRYLTTSLVGGGCDDPCTLCDLEYRDSCVDFEGEEPTLEEFNKGRWILHNAGVIESPEYMEDPVAGAGYIVRKVRFTLGSELPWKFSCPEICLDGAVFDGPSTDVCGQTFESFFCESSSLSCPVVEPSIVGEAGIIVEVQAGDWPLSGIVVEIIPDENGWVCDPLSAPPGFTPPAPCDVIYIEDLPPRYTLLYDTSIEIVKVYTNGGAELDGTPYISFDGVGGPPSFPVVRCGTFCVKISVDSCSVHGSPTATIHTVHREL